MLFSLCRSTWFIKGLRIGALMDYQYWKVCMWMLYFCTCHMGECISKMFIKVESLNKSLGVCCNLGKFTELNNQTKVCYILV